MQLSSTQSPISQAYKNTYYCLRHGTSVPNIQKIIVSSVEHGTSDLYGLADEGIKQAQTLPLDAVLQLSESTARPIVIIASDFSRAKQTATIVWQRLRDALCTKHQHKQQQLEEFNNYLNTILPPLELRSELRERFFGDLEGSSNANYDKVWEHDAKALVDGNTAIDGLLHSQFGCESLTSVATRTQRLVNELEARDYSSTNGSVICILVSHGDTLQIMQAQCFTQQQNNNKSNDTIQVKAIVRQHRSLPHLNTCELRKLN